LGADAILFATEQRFDHIEVIFAFSDSQFNFIVQPLEHVAACKAA